MGNTNSAEKKLQKEAGRSKFEIARDYWLWKKEMKRLNALPYEERREYELEKGSTELARGVFLRKNRKPESKIVQDNWVILKFTKDADSKELENEIRKIMGERHTKINSILFSKSESLIVFL
jgi:hypothetical protein